MIIFHLVVSGKVLDSRLFWVLCRADSRCSQPLKKSQLVHGYKPERFGLYTVSDCQQSTVAVYQCRMKSKPRESHLLETLSWPWSWAKSADKKDKMLYMLQALCFWIPRPKDRGYKNRKILSNLPQPLKERMERKKTGKFILKAITRVMALLEKGQLLDHLLDQGKLRDNSDIQIVPKRKENRICSWGS